MKENKYDDNIFFQKYSQMSRSQKGLAGAGGHISHVYSDRLSTRPRGWSKIGVEKMSKLLIYTKNGGRVYDLVMAQKQRKAVIKKREEQEILIKELRRLSSGYENVWNSKLTVLEKGHKTGLYNELKWLRGLCG
jgi:hypothetical protein